MNKPNFVWPVLIVGIGIVMLMLSADAIPDAYGDLLIRSWPVLLMMFGLNVLLAGRLRYANWIVFGLSVGLVVVIANLAYAERRNEYRDDYRETWLNYMPTEAETLIVRIEAKETRVTLSHAPFAGQMQARFEGSTESEVEVGLEVDGDVATFFVIERHSGILPKLPEVGRGTLNVFLPPGILIQELNYLGDDGPVTFDLSLLRVSRADIEVRRGNMKLCLPQTVADTVLIGDVRVGSGDLQLVVAPGLPLDLDVGDTNQLEAITYVPPGSSNDYLPLATGHLKSNITTNQFILLGLDVDGDLILDHESSCQQ